MSSGRRLMQRSAAGSRHCSALMGPVADAASVNPLDTSECGMRMTPLLGH